MLAAAADRERTMDVLKAAFSEGRLTKEEFESRATRVLSARTYGDLTSLASDLPSGPAGMAPVQPYSYYRQVAPRTPTNGLAVGSLICGILGLAAGVPAVILGHAARGQIRRSGAHGDGLAVTGMILGYLWISFWLIVIMASIVA